MQAPSKLMRRRKKFGRCPIHGQGCEVAHEIRREGTRNDDRRDIEQALKLATLEQMEQ